MPCWPGVMIIKSLLLTLFSLSAPQAFLAPHLAPHAPSAASFFSNWADAPKLLCNQTYRNHVPFTTRLMKSWQYLKPGLQEMSIYCKNLIYVKLTHEDETGAIRKRKGFISPSKKPRPRLFSSLSIDPIPFQPWTPGYLLPPSLGCVNTNPHPDQGKGFIHNIIRDYQCSALLKPGVAGSRAIHMERVALIS